MKNAQIEKAIKNLREIGEDATVPKNIKAKIDIIVSGLSKDEETQILVNRALNELDEVSDNNNIEPFIRTQLWSVVSILESVT